LWNFCKIYAIHKYGRRPHNTKLAGRGLETRALARPSLSLVKTK
jgi:hypothetical protein